MMFENLHRVMGAADTLKVACLAPECGHIREWSREQAISIYGPDAAPYDIRNSSKCGRCGERRRIGAYI